MLLHWRDIIMRKGFLFWSGIFLSILIAAILLIFLGHEPEERDLARVIPRPSGDFPYIFILADGNSFNYPMSQDFFETSNQEGFSLDPLKAIAPIASKADKAAVLMDFAEGETTIMASIKLPFEDLKNLSEGNIPEEWDEVKDLDIQRDENDVVYLSPSVISSPVFLKRDGGLLMVSTTLEGLEYMLSTLNDENESIQTGFGGLEDKYGNCFRIEDAGIISQVSTLYGIPANSGEVSIYCGWDHSKEAGKMEWRSDGIKKVLPDTFLNTLNPVKWDFDSVVREPVLFAAGINIPELKNRIYDLDLSEIGNDFDISSKDIVELSKGPTLFTVSGRSKFLLFSLPGLSLQFLDRGDAGRKLVRRFWTNKWSAFTPSINPVEGFDTGGSITMPMSLAGVANNDIAVLAFLESSYLEAKDLSSTIPLLNKATKSLFWAVIDGPGLSLALEKVSQAGVLAEKMGTDLGNRASDIEKLALKLREIGRISVLVTDVGSGLLTWNR